MAVKAFRSPMRVLPPLACEGAGGIRGSTSSQNSSLTVQGLVRAIPTATTPSLAEILDFHRSYQFSDKVLTSAGVGLLHLAHVSSSRSTRTNNLGESLHSRPF